MKPLCRLTGHDWEPYQMEDSQEEHDGCTEILFTTFRTCRRCGEREVKKKRREVVESGETEADTDDETGGSSRGIPRSPDREQTAEKQKEKTAGSPTPTQSPSQDSTESSVSDSSTSGVRTVSETATDHTESNTVTSDGGDVFESDSSDLDSQTQTDEETAEESTDADQDEGVEILTGSSSSGSSTSESDTDGESDSVEQDIPGIGSGSEDNGSISDYISGDADGSTTETQAGKDVKTPTDETETPYETSFGGSSDEVSETSLSCSSCGSTFESSESLREGDICPDCQSSYLG
ncbi:hypothetical protein ACEU6E_01455 [Halorutilales archaeon Cl-col2-1]